MKGGTYSSPSTPPQKSDSLWVRFYYSKRIQIQETKENIASYYFLDIGIGNRCRKLGRRGLNIVVLGYLPGRGV